MSDGTFDTVPHLFMQLYTLHGFIGRKSVPLVYALLPSKREHDYDALLDTIDQECLQRQINWAPQQFLLDFEQAPMNAYTNHFRNATTIKGCFFHLSQAVWRRIQAAGLQEDYMQDPELQLRMKMICACAFVPVQDVEQAFDDLVADLMPWAQQQQFQNPAAVNGIQTVINYFEETYVRGRLRRRGRRGMHYFRQRSGMSTMLHWRIFHVPRMQSKVGTIASPRKLGSAMLICTN